MTLVVLAKVYFNEGESTLVYGFSSELYTLSTSGLEGGQWFPLLEPNIGLRLRLSTEHDAASPVAEFGDITIADGGDINYEHIIDRLLEGRVEGAQAEVRRCYSDTTWDNAEVWFKSRSGLPSYSRRTLTIPQKPDFEWLKDTVTNSVHDDAPNAAIINRTVPVGAGEVFQDAGQQWDAQNLIWYLSEPMHTVRGAAEGGAPITEFVPLDWGAQLTAGHQLQMTFDHGGPAADTETQTEVVRWDFDTWTSGLPDGIDVTEISGVAEISEDTGGGAAIDVTPNTIGDTGWVTFVAGDTRVVQQGGVDWEPSGSGATLASDVEAADSDFATVTLDDGDFSDRVRWTGFDVSAVPADNVITGAEIELEHSGTDVEVWRLRVLDSIGRVIADFDRGAISVPASNGTETVGGTGDLGTQLEARTGANVADGASVEVMLRGDGSSPSYSLGRIRVKLHYGDEVNTLRLYTPGDVMTPGQRQRIRVDYENYEGLIQFGTVAASGDPVTRLLDPFADSAVRVNGSGRFFRWIRADEAVWAMAFKGAGTIMLVTVDEIKDAKNQLSEVVPWLVDYSGGDSSAIDTTSLNSLATDVGDPIMGRLYTGGEQIEEFLNLFVTDSCSGWWLPDRDGEIKFGFWTAPAASPDYTITEERIDADSVEVRAYEASFRTQRAVGARNETPIDQGEAAGITYTFSETDRAAISERWRVIRRADPDNLNPWPVA